jgi:hypothetical protein
MTEMSHWTFIRPRFVLPTKTKETEVMKLYAEMELIGTESE